MIRFVRRVLYLIPYVPEVLQWARKKKVSKRYSFTYYQFFQNLFSNFREYHLIEKANSIAFNFTLALFPAIIFIFTLIPYLPIEGLYDEVEGFLARELPESIYEVAAPTIHDIVNRQRGDLLSFSVLLSLYLATNGMIALMGSLNRIYRSKEKRNFIITRLIATALTFLLAFNLFFSLILFVVGQAVIQFVRDEVGLFVDYTIYLVYGLRFIVIFVLFFGTISFIYYLAPVVRKRWKFFSIGSLVATLSCIFVSYGFSFYINNFAAYNKLYGSIGVFIALMLWLSLIAIMLLIGFQINATYDKLKMWSVRGKPQMAGKTGN